LEIWAMGRHGNLWDNGERLARRQRDGGGLAPKTSVKEALKEVQEVKIGGRTRRVHVKPFAWNLHAPTQVEGTPEGRLLSLTSVP